MAIEIMDARDYLRNRVEQDIKDVGHCFLSGGQFSAHDLHYLSTLFNSESFTHSDGRNTVDGILFSAKKEES